MQESEMITRLVATEERSKSNTKRLDEVEAEIKENRDLTIAVKEIATEMKHLREDQLDMNKRLKIIEEKPYKQYEETKSQVKKQVISFFIGIGLTIIAFICGLGKFL